MYFFVQGRWLSGKLFSYLFSHLATVSDLKLVRIFSFCSWALFLEEFFRLGRRWQDVIGFDGILLLGGGIYIACCPSVAVYIGWGSCFVCGVANLLGLWSGHLFFSVLAKRGKLTLITFLSFLIAIFLGVASLFTYQVGFSCFFLPFVFYFVKNRADSFRMLGLFVAGYFVISVLYYCLFIISLKHASIQASDRTAITFDILGKLGFFLGVPLARAFSFNFLYNMHSIVSQGFPIVMMVLWLGSAWKREQRNIRKVLCVVSIFIILAMFTYMPVLAAKENFSSYRTMFMLNFVAVLILFDMLVHELDKRKKYKLALIPIAAVCLVVVGIWNFHYNYVAPLKSEYGAIRSYFNDAYKSNIQNIYFLRPPEKLFNQAHGINQYNDELGVPSTFRDWTPEPLMKQFILEKTESRTIADSVKIFQFTDSTLFEKEKVKDHPNSMYVNVQALYREDSFQAINR